jgi:hypothetical protein
VFYCVVTGAEGTPAKGKGGDWRLAALMEAVSGSQTEEENGWGNTSALLRHWKNKTD